MKKMPLITGAEADALQARSGQFGFRCFFGIHDKVWFFWPTYGTYRSSRRITCIRCGSLFDILLLSDEDSTRRTRAKDVNKQ